MIVLRKDNRKQKSKIENLISKENHFHKKLSRRSYQWGYTGEISKCITQKEENNFSLKIGITKTYPENRINDSTQER